jgi:hypothetical protein
VIALNVRASSFTLVKLAMPLRNFETTIYLARSLAPKFPVARTVCEVVK